MDSKYIHINIIAHAYTWTFHLMRTNSAPHTQPGRGVVIIAPPTVRSFRGTNFVCSYITACKPLCPLSGTRRLSVIRVFLLYYMYGDCSWCMQQCPLFGRRPLLGVSVNRESTVQRSSIRVEVLIQSERDRLDDNAMNTRICKSSALQFIIESDRTVRYLIPTVSI